MALPRQELAVQVGKAGNAIGNQFWKLMCEDSVFCAFCDITDYSLSGTEWKGAWGQHR